LISYYYYIIIAIAIQRISQFNIDMYRGRENGKIARSRQRHNSTSNEAEVRVSKEARWARRHSKLD